MRSAQSLLIKFKEISFHPEPTNSYELAEVLKPLSDELLFLFRYEAIYIYQNEIKPVSLNNVSAIPTKASEKFYSTQKISDQQTRDLFSRYNKSHVAPITPDGLFWIGLSTELFKAVSETIEYELFYYKLRSMYQTIAATRQLEQISLEHKLLNDVQLKITSSLDSQAVLNAILDGLQTLVGYDAASIFITVDGQEKVEQVIARGYDTIKLNLFKQKKEHGISASIYQLKEAVILGDVNTDPRYFKAREETRSQISVPMFRGAKVIGVFTLEKDHPYFYSKAALPLLQTFSEQAVISLDNAKLYQDSLQKQRLEKDMLDAAAIQSALLIRRAPKFEQVDISILYQANRYVGGDIYDIIRLSERSFYMNIGDVAGKGAPAAILMAVLFAGLRSQLNSRYQVCEHVARLNNLLSASTHSSSYATYFLAEFDGDSRTLTYTNAGHTPPLLVRKNGTVDRLSSGGMVIGFLKDQSYVQHELTVHKGDILVAFTDGLDEAFDENEVEFGIDRIEALIRAKQKNSAKQIKIALRDAVEDYHGSKLDDDLTIMIVKF